MYFCALSLLFSFLDKNFKWHARIVRSSSLKYLEIILYITKRTCDLGAHPEAMG